MKTLFYTREFPPYVYGGAGVHVEYLATELSKLMNVDVRCFGDQNSKKGSLTVKGFPFDNPIFDNSNDQLKAVFKTLSTGLHMNADAIDADIVHCHTWYAHFAGIIAKLCYGIPLVITTHSLEPLRPWKREQLGRGYDASSWIEKTAIEILKRIKSTKNSFVEFGAGDGMENNTYFDWELGDEAATNDAFDKAATIVKVDIRNNRVIPNAMEPRAAVADYDTGDGRYTLFTTSQNPQLTRLVIGAFMLNIPESKFRVVAPDVGGGFGSKIYVYPEEAVCVWASKKLGRAVKWTADRTQAFLGDAHGRDHISEVKLALDKNNRITGLRVDTLANLGAYLSAFAMVTPTYLHGTLLSGVYDIPAIYTNVKGICTNTVNVDAYRGAGRPEATYLLERTMDVAAKQVGMDPAEFRRLNFIPKDAFPYQTAVALQYDIGDYEPLLDRAMTMIDYKNFESRRAKSAKNGKCRGIGISTYIEACGIAPSAVVGALGGRVGLYESAVVRVDPTGTISVLTGTHSHGQGHDTTFAQLVCDKLGVDIEAVEIVHGDSDRTAFGMGTYGSRSLAVGGTAISKALDKVIAKGKIIAAHMLEADDADIEFKDGKFTVAGTDREKSFGEIALSAYVPHNFPHDRLEPGLEETSFYDPLNFTYPSGTHIAEVEIDPATGVVELVDWVCCDDFGNLINPMVVEGQVHGGIAQGVGQALYEEAAYNDNGQLLSASYMDYCMPRADHFPSMKVENLVTACTHNDLGVKGCGEAGAIASPPAVINAVVDALSPLGVTDITMPATPQKVWQAIQAAQTKAAE